MGKLIFVTGTDTGVGKTMVTAGLVSCLRAQGARAWGMKPFCSGDRHDAELLQRCQPGELSMEECNPFFFPQALAPGVAMRLNRRRVTLRQACENVARLRERCDVLVVEGAGGLLVPMGQGFDGLDWMEALGLDSVVLVSANHLGTVNHTRLTYEVLHRRLRKKRAMRCVIVLNETGPMADESKASNARTLREWLPGIALVEVGFWGEQAAWLGGIGGVEKKMKKVLAQILDSGNFAAR